MEIWKPIPSLNGDYEASSQGRIRSTKKIITKSNGIEYTRISKVLKPALNPDGYESCGLSINGKNTTFKVHRLVAETFIENQERKPQVNHINGIKNDNKVENLEWVTISENIKHSYRKKLRNPKVGSLNGMSKLSEKEVSEIRIHAKNKGRYYGRAELAKKYGVSECTIKEVVTRRKNKFYNVP